MTETLFDIEEILDGDEPETIPENEPFTVSAARALGFSTEEIAVLRESGLLRESYGGVPWRPRTLEDVSWIVLQLRLLEAEEHVLREQLKRRLKRINDRTRWLMFYEADCQEITATHLPRSKSGKLQRKSLDLEDGRVGLRTAPGGPRIVDEQALVDAIVAMEQEGLLGPELAEAVRLTETLVGRRAVQRILEPWKRTETHVKVLATPVKAFVAALPPVPDPGTGEALPATLPGVEIAAPVERWYWE